MFGPQCQAESRGVIVLVGPLLCWLPWSDIESVTFVAVQLVFVKSNILLIHLFFFLSLFFFFPFFSFFSFRGRFIEFHCIMY